MKNPTIMGAIVGDTIGSVYEFNPTKEHDFLLFQKDSIYTDDSIMTIAVAEWLMDTKDHDPESLIRCMQKWGRRYPNPYGAYGTMFSCWLRAENPQPYNSWGNGSAMRVGAVGFWCKSLSDTLKVAEISASVSHNHPEGIKGAQATAAAVFMAKEGCSKEEIKRYVSSNFDYNLDETCSQIRKYYSFDGSCQGTVPQSIIAFLESTDFEDSIRLCVSLGGDADTMGTITGAIAAAYYKEIPNDIYDITWRRMTKDLQEVVLRFNESLASNPS